MPARLRAVALMLMLLGVALALSLSAPIVGIAGASEATNAPKVPLTQWTSTFCTSFAAYETNALAAQATLQTAFAGVKDSTEGASIIAELTDGFTKTSQSAQAAATAATANGVPDVAKGAALAGEIDQTLVATGKAYAKAAKKSPSLPTAPKKLHQAARSIARDIAAALDPKSPHAKRLKKLDPKNTVATAISSDPVCAAAASPSGTTTPATPSTSTP